MATEDSRFFQHNGFDAARFFKAGLGQILGNSDAGGASTLSMQVIKNSFTSSEATGIKGIVRKFTDIYLSVFKLEKGGNVFYWDYECFLDVIDKRLGITSILSDYKDSTSEGYKLFINWDDQYSDTVVNDVGEEVFEDYDMEYHFNFIDGMKYYINFNVK